MPGVSVTGAKINQGQTESYLLTVVSLDSTDKMLSNRKESTSTTRCLPPFTYLECGRWSEGMEHGGIQGGWSEEPLPGDVARSLPSLPSRRSARSGDGLVGDSDLEQRGGELRVGRQFL